MGQTSPKYPTPYKSQNHKKNPLPGLTKGCHLLTASAALEFALLRRWTAACAVGCRPVACVSHVTQSHLSVYRFSRCSKLEIANVCLHVQN